MNNPILFGSQSFPLQHVLEEDFDGSIRRLHQIGFDAFEPLAFFNDTRGRAPAMFLSFRELRRAWDIIAPLGMTMPSMHVAAFTPEMRDVSHLSEGMLRANEMTGTDHFVFSGMFRTAEGAREWADLLNQLSRKVQPDGLKVLYHNHASELASVEVDGKKTTALEYFVSLLEEPAGLEPDIGWLGINADEVALMKAFAPRVVELHLKDFPADRIGKGLLEEGAPADMFCTIGAGGIRTKEVLQMIPEWPAFDGLIVLDQDQTTSDIFDDLERGLHTVKEMLA